MKKLMPILFLALLLLGCTQTNNSAKNKSSSKDTANSAATTTLNISNIFPFKQDVQLKYTSSESPTSNSNIYIDFIKTNRMQFRIVTSDSSVGYVLENKNGELRLITSRNSFYYHEDLTSIQNVTPEIILKEPLVKGTSWLLPNGNKRYISKDNVEIATASGKYIALEVTTESSKGKIINYYAPKVGLVKTISNLTKKSISSLEAIVEDAVATETVNFYYPNPEKDSLMFFKRQLHFKTGDAAKTFFEKYFKEAPTSSLTKVISLNTKIEKLYLNTTENKVYVDFSKEFRKEMNLGSSGESAVLKCITNTLCDYFNVDKLSLTVEGKPYESGHIILKSNEPLYIDAGLKNIVEFK